MNTKKFIASLLDHPKIKENLQYQKLQKLFGAVGVHNVVLKDQTTFYQLDISFLGYVKKFNLYKNEIDYGHITLKKYGGKVDHQLIVTGFVRIWKSDCEDILLSGSDKENINVRISGPLNNNDPWLQKLEQK